MISPGEMRLNEAAQILYETFHQGGYGVFWHEARQAVWVQCAKALLDAIDRGLL